MGGDFAEVLKTGVVLCKLMNKIQPDSVKKFKEKGPAFLLMENVQTFLAAAKKYGVPDEEVFQGEGTCIPADGERADVPGCCKEVWSAGRGSLPDAGFVRGQKHPPGGSLPLLLGPSNPEAPRVHRTCHWAKDG